MFKHSTRTKLLLAAALTSGCMVLTNSASAAKVTGQYRFTMNGTYNYQGQSGQSNDRGTATVKLRRITAVDEGRDGDISRVNMRTNKKIRNNLNVQLRFLKQPNRVLVTGTYNVVGDRGFWAGATENGRIRGVKPN